MALRKSKTNLAIDPASFRDNFGFVYHEAGGFLRQVNDAGKTAYDALMTSGLYDELTKQGLLVKHTELPAKPADGYKTLRPELINFISYPYEWSFSQFKDAALATLQMQKLALAKTMTLRDASAYNIQFVSGKPQMIDTLSFEPYKPGEPWQAYRQFCQHFLAPLALAAHIDVDLTQLMRVYIDGVPLALAGKLLPGRSLFNPGLYMHIKLHGRFQDRYSEGKPTGQTKTVSQTQLLGVIDSLERTVKGLQLPKTKTEWGDYYNNTNYSPDAFAAKQGQVKSLIDSVKPRRVIDLGANNGAFSRLAQNAELVISADIDPMAVEHNYRLVKKNGETNLLPLLIDLTNPSPDLGWANRERPRFDQRAKGDLVLALALIHHLAIGNNLPLEAAAEYFAELAPNLIIEFVPKADSQAQRLLAAREDIFNNYTQAGFETAFSKTYKIIKQQPVKDSKRIIYLMRKLGG